MNALASNAVYQGDWDIRGSDLDQRYARFAREPLSDDEILWLSLASRVMPANSIADKLFLTSRSGCDCYLSDIAAWGDMVADGIAKALYRAKTGKRRRTYVEGYDARWGRQAARDGLAMAMFGPRDIPGVVARADQFGCGKQAYQRVRDFVGGAAAVCMEEYRWALLWAMGRIRDRMFDARLDGLNGMERGYPAIDEVMTV